MIERLLLKQIKNYISKFPIITVTGVRQCGKTTLLRESLPTYTYVSLEDPDVRSFAADDPRGFLNTYKAPCIFDEIQRVPEMFSYLQTKVDESGKMGEYILSGSHNFLLMQSISQSLAGRTALLTLAPFSVSELKAAGRLPEKTTELMLKGFYPAIYARSLEPSEYFPSYIRTYIDRDIRLIRNIPDSDTFIKFVKLLAARSGQVINRTELSNACDISVPTVRAWMSVLSQSYVIFELPVYHKNFSKRLVKSPKIYFYDTGLLCFLLGIESEAQLNESPNKGAVFETMVVSEYMKYAYSRAKEPACYYWRDSNQNEVDLLIEENGKLKIFEIKSGTTMDRKYLKGLKKFADIAGIDMSDAACIYDGAVNAHGEAGSFVRFTDFLFI